jgi:hypothetical protein
MFIFVVSTLQKKWNEIRMKELAGGKCMKNDCFLRTLKFEMFIWRDVFSPSCRTALASPTFWVVNWWHKRGSDVLYL